MHVIDAEMEKPAGSVGVKSMKAVQRQGTPLCVTAEDGLAACLLSVDPPLLAP